MKIKTSNAQHSTLNVQGACFERSKLNVERWKFFQVQRAFTLLELLIAVVAFAIVLAAINGVFYSALKLRNRSAASLEKSLPLTQVPDHLPCQGIIA